MRSLTTKERNYITNLPLESYQKQRIENVWSKCTEPVIGSEEEVKKKNSWIPSPNKLILIVLLLFQLYYPTRVTYITIQVFGWVGISIIAVVYYLVYRKWIKSIELVLLPESLNRLYKPLPISIYLYYVGECVIAYVMYIYGYTALAIAYAVVMIGIGLIANIAYTSHIKYTLNGGPDIDMKIHFLQEYSLKKKNKLEVDVYITFDDKNVL